MPMMITRSQKKTTARGRKRKVAQTNLYSESEVIDNAEEGASGRTLRAAAKKRKLN